MLLPLAERREPWEAFSQVATRFSAQKQDQPLKRSALAEARGARLAMQSFRCDRPVTKKSGGVKSCMRLCEDRGNCVAIAPYRDYDLQHLKDTMIFFFRRLRGLFDSSTRLRVRVVHGRVCLLDCSRDSSGSKLRPEDGKPALGRQAERALENRAKLARVSQMATLVKCDICSSKPVQLQ